MPQIPQFFRNSRYEQVPYDGSPVTWRVSVYGICIQDNALLLVKQKNDPLWDIPGGGVELDEELTDALTREGHEEAGWELRVGHFINTQMDWFYHSREHKFYRTLQLYYEVEGQQTGKPTDERTEEARLVLLSELDQIKLYPNIKLALAARV